MIGWIARILLVLAGFITSIFVARDELNFDFIQMVVGVLLFTLFVAFAAFFPTFLTWLRKRKHRNN